MVNMFEKTPDGTICRKCTAFLNFINLQKIHTERARDHPITQHTQHARATHNVDLSLNNKKLTYAERPRKFQVEGDIAHQHGLVSEN